MTWAIALPGLFELIVFLMFAGGIVVAIVSVVVLGRERRAVSAFPVIPTADADGPGRYRVVGVDRATRADRELNVEAASRANAQVKAELEGIVVTEVRKQP